jgi:phosphoglycolate phosphatase
MRKLQAVLWDVDGTLIDSLDDIVEAANHVRIQRGFSVASIEQVQKYVGHGAEHLLSGLIPGLRGPELETAVQSYISAYCSLSHPKAQPFKGISQVLERLMKQGIRLGVVTNKATRSAGETLKRLFPEIQFLAVLGPERVSHRKPHPAHLLECLQCLGVLPEEACFIGDDLVDAKCAHDAGVEFVGVSYGIGNVQSRNQASSPEDIEDILEGLFDFRSTRER